MNLTELFEEEDEIGIKAPNIAQRLAEARTEYGYSGNDLNKFLKLVQENTNPKDDNQEFETEDTIQVLENFIQLLEGNEIEFEPQPEFRGRGGIATAYGDSAKRQRGMQGTASANNRYQKEKTPSTNLNQLWMRYLKQLKTLSPENKREMVPILRKLVKAARDRNVALTPNPDKFQFLQNG